MIKSASARIVQERLTAAALDGVPILPYSFDIFMRPFSTPAIMIMAIIIGSHSGQD
jgi:hypothetical protein